MQFQNFPPLDAWTAYVDMKRREDSLVDVDGGDDESPVPETRGES